MMKVVIVGFVLLPLLDVYDHLSTSSYRVERVNTPKTSSGTSCIRKMMSVLSCLIAIISLVFGIKTRLFPVYSLASHHA